MSKFNDDQKYGRQWGAGNKKDFIGQQPLASPLWETWISKVLERSGLKLSCINEQGTLTVCKARDGKLGKDVSVKILPSELAPNDEFRQRFIQQAQISRIVDSPYVEKVFRVVEEAKTVLVVSEFIKGKTLFDRLEKDGPMGWEDAKGIFLQMCDAMSVVHSHGVVHRDLTPDHIIIEDGTGKVKILDFFLAKMTDEGKEKIPTLPGSVMGPPEYMSPEQAKGSPVDHRSDIYSMGAVMYEMLAGEPPFKLDMSKNISEAWMDIGLSVLNEHPMSPRRKLGRLVIPATVEKTIYKCLSKDPAERFQSMHELKESISAW